MVENAKSENEQIANDEQESRSSKDHEPKSHEEAKEEPGLSEVEELRQKLELKEQETKENLDRLLRQAAETENYKKRMARDKEEAIRYANESLIRDLLPVLDNLERATEHAKGGGNGKPLLEGIDMVLKGFIDVLGKHGVTQISAKGERFNPEIHEAFAQVGSEDHEPNTVVEEVHKGYFLLNRLLRPSLVSVAKLPETGEKTADEEKVENGEGDD
jgi:molecular chaperone GrpE